MYRDSRRRGIKPLESLSQFAVEYGIHVMLPDWVSETHTKWTAADELDLEEVRSLPAWPACIGRRPMLMIESAWLAVPRI